MNQAGTIRGNYYDGLMDTTTPVYGSVDKKTQRAAWSIGKKTDRVFEALGLRPDPGSDAGARPFRQGPYTTMAARWACSSLPNTNASSTDFLLVAPPSGDSPNRLKAELRARSRRAWQAGKAAMFRPPYSAGLH